MDCPCCGAPIEEFPVTALTELPLPEKRMRILTELVRAYPRYITTNSLLDVVYQDDSDGGPLTGRNVISVQVTRIRDVLAHLGWTVSMNGKGYGNLGKYRLEKLKGTKR